MKPRRGRPRTHREKLGTTIRADRMKYLQKKKLEGQRIGHIVDRALDMLEGSEE